MCSKSDYAKLSDDELLSMFVSEDTAKYLLKEFSSLENILLHAYPQELVKFKGIGNKVSERLKAIGVIADRLYQKSAAKVTKINSPQDVFEICKDMQHLKQEMARAIYLNVKNDVVKIETISIGSTTSSLLSPKEVFSRAIKLMCEATIIVHNHPSGHVSPSKDDIRITAKLKNAGEIIGIQLLDHIIIGKGRYLSLQEYNGMKGD